MIDWVVAAGEPAVRLDAWLARRPEIGSRLRARAAIECGKVLVDGVEAVFSDRGRLVAAGTRIGFWPDRPGSRRPRTREVAAARATLHVVLEDHEVIVVDKRPGWLVEPLPGERQGEVTVLDLLVDHLRGAAQRRPFVVHRIDRDTSGLVLFALTPSARDHLKDQFERRTPQRIYLAVVAGQLDPAAGTWRDTLVWDRERLVQKRAHAEESRGKDAVARYRVLEQYAAHALIEVALVTGKRNQIRVQAGLRGHPLVGEKLYRFGHAPGEDEPAFDRQALHAARLAFRHPGTGRRVTVEAPVPEDLRALIERLRAGGRPTGHRGVEASGPAPASRANAPNRLSERPRRTSSRR